MDKPIRRLITEEERALCDRQQAEMIGRILDRGEDVLFTVRNGYLHIEVLPRVSRNQD